MSKTKRVIAAVAAALVISGVALVPGTHNTHNASAGIEWCFPC